MNIDTSNLSIRTKATVEDGIQDMCPQTGEVHFVDYQPGNGTAYRFTLHRCPEGSPLALWHFSGNAGWVVFFVPELRFKQFAFSALDTEINPLWLKEKVGCGLADAVVLAEVLQELTEKP